MATQLASIGVGKLSSTAKYVDTFIVEIYSDSGYTVKIGQQTSTAQWNGSAWVQKDAIIFGGLVFGTTYYLRAAVIAPTSGAISAWTTFNTAAGSASAPGCTYTGTFTATTSGIGYIVTPASVPSDIDHFEAVWVWDSSTPASTIGAYWTGQITNSNITFFVGGKPGDTAKVYVRAVNTSQQAQAWQLIDTRTVSTTWSGTTIGTIGDGTLLGTGGPAVNSGSTGKVGLGGSPVSDNLLTTFGSGRMGPSGSAPFFRMNDTGTSGRNYGLFDTTGAFLQYDETASSTRTTITSGGLYGIGGSPSDIFDAFGTVGNIQGAAAQVRVRDTNASGVDGNLASGTTTAGTVYIYRNGSPVQFLTSTGVGINGSPSNKLSVFGGSDDGLLISNPEPSVFYADTTVGSRQYQQYGLSNNFSVWDNTAASNRLILNSSGQYGIGGAPSNQLHVFGNPFVTASGYDFRATNTQASGRTFGVGSQSGWDGVGYYQMALDHTAASQRLRMDSSGMVGFNLVPAQPFDVVGLINSSSTGAGLITADRSGSGVRHMFYANSGYGRLWNDTGADVVTWNRSTGNMGIGGTFTGDWISVQGASVLDSNKVVAGGVRGYRFTGSGSATWVKLGTWTFNNAGTGRSIHVDIVSANGFNSGSSQQAHIELIARSGNAAAAPNISGGSYYGRGGSTPVTGFKIVAVGGSTAVNNGAWELWVNTSTFADMIVSPMVDSGDTFVWAGTTGADPGAASSSIVVGVGGMVMNTGGTGTDAIIDSTGNPLSGGKRGFIGFTSSSNLVSGQKVGGDSGSVVNGSGGFAGFGITPSSFIAFSGDIIIQAASTVKVRINNTAGHQWSVASV